MKTSFLEFSEFSVSARDGEVGHVRDVYFDDLSWKIRYLVVDTRKWLGGRRVLLAPAAIESLNLTHAALQLNLTRAQVESAPAFDEHVPLNRQTLMDLNQHYGWSHYWITGGPLSFSFPTINYGPIAESIEIPDEVRAAIEARHQRGDDQLLSLKELTGWSLAALDGERAGTVRDAVINYQDWTMPYLVIDTGHWIAGRKVILPASFVETFDPEARVISVRTSAESIATAPEFDLDRLDEGCERSLVDHYFQKMDERRTDPTRDVDGEDRPQL